MRNCEEIEKIIHECIAEKDPVKHPYFVIDPLPGMSTYVDTKEKADKVDCMINVTAASTSKPNLK